MKKYLICAISSVFVMGSLFWSAAGCAPRSTVYGQPIIEKTVTSIGMISAKPDTFAGQTVRVEGEIAEVCPSGCWFRLKDNSGVVYVDLNPSAFVIPQIRGRTVVVQGVVKKEYTNVMIIGTGVQLK